MNIPPLKKYILQVDNTNIILLQYSYQFLRRIRYKKGVFSLKELYYRP